MTTETEQTKPQRVMVRIRRQKDVSTNPYWEEFAVPYQANMNVITLLMEIQKHPVNAKRQETTPVVWTCNCLEEVCGACTMVINGGPRQACSALVDSLKQPVEIKPLSKFPVVRDLIVDRSVMFENLQRIKAWIPIDGTHAIGPGPRMAKKDALTGYKISRCMTCGCCLEGCPQVNHKTDFIGPAAVAQARLFNIHPTGKMNKEERIETLIETGGIAQCGNAQNCERLCPKQIPLLSSLAIMNRETTRHFIKKLLWD